MAEDRAFEEVKPGSAPPLCSRERSPSCTVELGEVHYRLCESEKLARTVRRDSEVFT